MTRVSSIYALVNRIDRNVYIGKSQGCMQIRLKLHKKECERYPNRRLYENICKYGWNNIHMMIIKQYKNISPYELRNRESYYINLIGTLNSQRPSYVPFPDELNKHQVMKMLFNE